jgi:hypothetical protein
LYNALEKGEAAKNDMIETLRENNLKYRALRKCDHMDIPYEAGQNTSVYNSTRGHKINHSFVGKNTCLTFHDSARFGIVNSIISRVNLTITKGTELLNHYGYAYSSGPRWYKKLFKDFLRGVYASEKTIANRFKDYHFADGTSMEYSQFNILHLEDILDRLPRYDLEDIRTILLLYGLIKDHGKKHHCSEIFS